MSEGMLILLPQGRDILSLWGRRQEQQNLTVFFIIAIVLVLYICVVSQEHSNRLYFENNIRLKRVLKIKLEIQYHAKKEHTNE